MRAYGDEAVARITEKLRVMILEAKDQPADSKAYGSLENTTQFGVAAQVGWAARPGCCAAARCGALCCAVVLDAVLVPLLSLALVKVHRLEGEAAQQPLL